MATKTDLKDIRSEMATKTDINKLDKKLDKTKRDLLDYLEHIDSELQEHRRDSEVHTKVLAG
jgi:hypothetical protein